MYFWIMKELNLNVGLGGGFVFYGDFFSGLGTRFGTEGGQRSSYSNLMHEGDSSTFN